MEKAYLHEYEISISYMGWRRTMFTSKFPGQAIAKAVAYMQHSEYAAYVSCDSSIRAINDECKSCFPKKANKLVSA
jgi:hypothetical protein